MNSTKEAGEIESTIFDILIGVHRYIRSTRRNNVCSNATDLIILFYILFILNYCSMIMESQQYLYNPKSFLIVEYKLFLVCVKSMNTTTFSILYISI